MLTDLEFLLHRESFREDCADSITLNKTTGQNEYIEVIFCFPLLRPERLMSISFESEEIILKKLRERLRRMTDQELIKFGKDVRRLAENPFQKQLEEARAEWKRRRQSRASR